MVRDYIFDTYTPNLYLLILSLLLFTYLVFVTTDFQGIVIGVMFLTLGWSVTFSKRRIPRMNKEWEKLSQQEMRDKIVGKK